ncbi:50S ribosomal protein L18 [Candidatus Curtissbacteria bacterium RIFCSPHIGHO2_01_FULL_41_44]|uniref:Large ribosomal subunit protein uL18 n=1 Tax=Candidatus Curtissbacteria bacterium RIFCSPLOWO2_01_FULL_42_50 TaxID=1797730 RepID=A0A1F5H2I7_9BACT|nr:MAG: 50S ribosomal protein L18 [Candidatus Curtissbacteria bacterium RIFCSPHIGHO2_02_FULL_42_58]OGD94759.1 MAG: 50S ribosomal protein L18 [Candidatus Curtissbacteria bacterium RIFCSPHIGHO2_01_FULL_41_44]OGD96302.1 MAG: 50S ribosomal protein L18 [Candidatus Curtissbacteria bacterium RIFCSPHIGHO2_12_FULL_42_33]OGD98321.1 MAG: 50S ribosomal protein L18 [Candidatus Curtissbacteria bacterium RIFCSPLOWO2_01_FULL_42_50]OGE02958.1 MAG: 50S ribosomal protein L18 [Candidatus Curtissbacteria bacterium 
MKDRRKQKVLRHDRIRKKIARAKNVPRIVVFRSNKHIYAQLIDDQKAATIAFASDAKIKKGTRCQKAKEVGINLAKAAKSKNIKKVVYDRAGYFYHGRVKALAEGAREEGLLF